MTTVKLHINWIQKYQTHNSIPIDAIKKSSQCHPDLKCIKKWHAMKLNKVNCHSTRQCKFHIMQIRIFIFSLIFVAQDDDDT